MHIVVDFIFYFFIIAAIFTAISIIFSNNIFRILIAVFSVFCTAGILLFILNLPFLASAQIVISAVGFIILSLAFLTLLNNKDFTPEIFSPRLLYSIPSLLFLLCIIFIFLKYGTFFTEFSPTSEVNTMLVPLETQVIILKIVMNYSAVISFIALIFLTTVIGIRRILFSKTKDIK